MDSGIGVLILIVVGLILFRIIANKIISKFNIKTIKNDTLCVVSGGIKTGKTAFALHLALKDYRRRKRKFRIMRALRLRKDLEEPLLYSNIPLAVPYVPLTRELLMREVRPNFGSVLFVDEASLLADSQLIKDKELNDKLLVFCKLFGHETHGGSIYLSTHTVEDMHYAFKRVTSQYIYIHSLVKWLPFVLCANVVESRYSSDNSVIAVDTQDIENIVKKVFFSKSVFKKYDCYAFSKLTDSLPKDSNVISAKSLKTDTVVSFSNRFEKLKK